MVVFTALLILTVAGACCSRRGAPRRAAKAAAIGLFLFCWTPFSMLVVRAVQSPYSRQPPADSQAGAIVVLAGAVHPPLPPLPEPVVGSNTYERCRYAAWLHREWRSLPLVLSGGSQGDAPTWPYAEAMRVVVIQEGVPASRIAIENRSRSTAENAQFSAVLLRQRAVSKIVLVTDAVHMRRAKKTFEKQGLTVVPAPCAFRPVYDLSWEDALPSWRAIQWNEDVLHEAIGLVWYWIRGEI